MLGVWSSLKSMSTAWQSTSLPLLSLTWIRFRLLAWSGSRSLPEISMVWLVRGACSLFVALTVTWSAAEASVGNETINRAGTSFMFMNRLFRFSNGRRYAPDGYENARGLVVVC